MKSSDEMGATTEPTKRQSATVAGSDNVLGDYDAFHAFRATFEAFQPTSDQHKPAADRYVDHDETSERKAIYDRLLSIKNEIKRRGSRASRWFAGRLVAICIGVAATLGWQSYGGVVKHAVPTAPATPTIDPQVQQIALDVASVRQSVEQLVSAGRQIDPDQVQQIALDVAAVRQSVEQQIAAVRQTVEQLAASQDQMTHRIDALQTSEREILEKIPAPAPQRPIAAPARKPTPTTQPSSRAPSPSYLRPYP